MNVSHRLLGLVLGACAPAWVQAEQGAQLDFRHAWIRSAPPSSPVMAGYVEIRNPTRTEQKIAAVESEAFAVTELHEMREINGVMRMRPLNELALLPEDGATLAPGGLHLMLMRPVQALSPGDLAQITFVLGDGQRQTVAFEVRVEAPDGD